MGELYGESNPITQEWTDGIIASIVRQAVEATDGHKKWVTFDGPVDAVWIENMNTVLDDNKLLCLPNGERIKLPGTVSMMFEVNDLAVASPATVSRCGMVFLEPIHLGWMPIVRTWAETKIEPILPGHGPRLTKMVESAVTTTLKFIREECSEHIASVDINLVNSMLQLLSALLKKQYGVPSKVVDATVPKPGDNIEKSVDGEDVDGSVAKEPGNLSAVDLASLVDHYFAFAFVWSCGANLDDASRIK